MLAGTCGNVGIGELCCGVEIFGDGAGGGVGSGARVVDVAGGAVTDVDASTRAGATGTSFPGGPPAMRPQATAGTATIATADRANLPTMESRAPWPAACVAVAAAPEAGASRT